MKKVSAIKVVASVVTAALLASPVLGATTGTAVFSSVVAPILSISITPAAGAAALNPALPSTAQNIGTMHVASNGGNGFKVSLTSLNAFSLKDPVGLQTVAYKVTLSNTSGVDASYVSPAVVDAVPVSGKIDASYTKNGATLVNPVTDAAIAMAVKFDTASLRPGTYADTITASLTAL